MKKNILLSAVLLLIILIFVSCNGSSNIKDYTEESVKEYLLSKGFEVTETRYAEDYTYYDATLTNFTMRIYESNDVNVLNRLYSFYEDEAEQIYKDYIKASSYKDKGGGTFFNNDENPTVHNPSEANMIGAYIVGSEAKIYMTFYRNIKENLLITCYFDQIQDYDKETVNEVLNKYCID